MMLINYLLKKDEWVTSFSIASDLDYSIRVVKKYVAEINSEYDNLINTSRKGFLVNKEWAYEIIENTKKSDIPQNSKSRINYMYKKMLLGGEKVDLTLLAEELCVSEATLSLDISKLRKALCDYDLVCRTRKNLMYLEGSEKNKKKLLSSLIFAESQDSFLTLELLEQFFPTYDIRIIKHIVTKHVGKFDYFIDDYSLLNIILHFVVCLNRANYEHSIVKSRVEIPNEIKEILNDICEELGTYFSVYLSDGDVNDLSLLLMARVISQKDSNISVKSLPEIVDEKVISIFEEIKRKVNDVFLINLDNDDFVIRFCLHLKNLLFRLEHNIEIKNPQLSEIKNKYLFIYDVSCFISNIIFDETQYKLSEDEIAYFALHVGVLIDEQKALQKKLKCVILVPQNNTYYNRIISKIYNIFDEQLIVSNIISFSSELEECEEYDLLITTMDLESSKPNWIHVSSFLSNKDIQRIFRKIDVVNKTKTKVLYEQKLKNFFSEELFLANQKFVSNTDIIDALCEKLIKLDYVPKEYREKVYEREKISSSSFDSIALPHPLEMISKKTAIAVLINESPVEWNGYKVNIVFMLAINEEDRSAFNEIFDFITEVINDKLSLKKLLSCTSFQEFMDILLQIVE